MRTLFFATGSGRCGTMWLSNLLNSEQNTLALHEGKIRVEESVGDQYLPFLTLQNKQAYDNPSVADFLFDKYRKNINDNFEKHNVGFFGDIAYNYAPFLSSIRTKYPSAKVIFLYRNGIDFVRSSTTNEEPDPVPVGWPPKGKKLSKLERYINLGRISPRGNDPLYRKWSSLSVVAKNAWLWAETNRIIIEQLAEFDNDNVLTVRFEDFVSSPQIVYDEIRRFLCIEHPISTQTKALLTSRINSRSTKYPPIWEEWSANDKADFLNFAGAMMKKLDYGVDC